MKICFYYTVFFFRLPICLSVKRDEKLFFDTKKIVKQKPKLRYKICSIIIDNRVWEDVLLYYHVDDYFCKSWSINGNFD